jgi:L-alanine-DL-glutamate epimerase-like enolase superfamily enzyme
VKRTLLRLSIPIRQPFVTAGGVVTERELLLLLLEGSDGTVGWGEAAPFEPYDGVPLERAIAALSGGGGRGRAPARGGRGGGGGGIGDGDARAADRLDRGGLGCGGHTGG